MEDDHAEDGETVDHSQVVGQLCLSRAEVTRGQILEELEHPAAAGRFWMVVVLVVGGSVSQPSNYLRLSQTVTV